MSARDPIDLLPLRQMVAASGDAARVFAGQAMLDWLSRPGRYQLVACGGSAQILAASEWALAEAQVVLRQAYGDLVRFGIPAVHTYVDADSGAAMVPVIFLRIDAARQHAAGLQALLQGRGAQLREVDLQSRRVVLRAELELGRALGLQREIGELTDGAAHILSWLVRYQPATQATPPDRAVGAAAPAGA